MRTWILVAHRSGAKLFEKSARLATPVLVKDFPHDAGRLKDGAIYSDRPGRSFDRTGQRRHALSHEEEPTEKLADAFAKTLATELHTGAHEKAFDELVLIAEPRFLGRLRDHLSSSTAAYVVREVPKDLPDASAADVERYVVSEWAS